MRAAVLMSRDGQSREHSHEQGHGHNHGHNHGRSDGQSHGGTAAGSHPAWRPAVGASLRSLGREWLGVAAAGVALALGIGGEWLGWPAGLTRALFLGAVLAGAVEIVPKGLHGVVRERSLDINFLVSIAVAGALLLGEWGEAATVVFLFSLGEALEDLTLRRTRRSIQALMAMAPDTAQVRTPDGRERTMAAEAVPAGATVVVRPGDRIPLDGVVVTGESSVDQAPITGESVPVDRGEGDPVFAGTINGAGYLEIRTTRPFAENTLAKIIHLVEEAQSEKAPAQRFVERFARIYTPAVVVGALLVVAVPPLLFDQPLVPWFNRALVLLLVACPCALVISTPVSVVAAIGNASRHGVLIKGGAYLERAGTLRAVAFDKTGTLTRGVPEVRLVVPFGGRTAEAVLGLAAAAEARSEHPLAGAIVRAAHRQRIALPAAAERFRATAGSGVFARIEGTDVLVGRPSWLEGQGVSLRPAEPALAALTEEGHTPVVVARLRDREPAEGRPDGARDPGGGGPPPRDGGTASGAAGEVVGVIAIADELRPAARETIAALRGIGVRRIVLLTGDSAATAHAIARQAGIAPEDVRAELLPAGKADAIRALQRQHGGVAMVGDGVNDAPALAAATVGIAMGAAGSDTALETADVALVADDLSRLPWVLKLSRAAAWTIRFNVAFALTTKLVVLALAAAGIANLWLAIAADTGASVVVILNGMRLIGRAPLPPPVDAAALRRRYGLEEEHAHAGHAH